MTKIHIYHTNDVHSNFNELCSIATYLKKHKKTNDLLLDAGDFHDFKDSMISGTKGKAGKSLLNHMGYDAICVGNNEGFSSIECLNEMSKDTVPLLSVNLSYLDHSELPFLKKSCIIEKSNIRFLIIGITPFYNRENNDGYNAFFRLENLKVHDPVELIKAEMSKYTGQFDFVIGLSHLGITYDQKIAAEIDGLDIIIGGHSHTLCDTIVRVNTSIIHQAGAYASHLGHLELDIVNNQIVQSKGTCIAIHEEKNVDLLKLIELETIEANNNLSTVLRINHALDFDPIHENGLINFICDALYQTYKCDFALMNHGIISYPLPNEISEMSVLNACPSPLNPTLIQVYGYQIKQAISDSFNQDICLAHGKGPGFRGLFVGSIGVSHNVEIHQEPLTIKIDHKDIEEDKQYQVMTSDYLQRGTGYPSLKVSNEDSIFYAGYIRDVIMRNINDENLHHQSKTKRIIKVIDNI